MAWIINVEYFCPISSLSIVRRSVSSFSKLDSNSGKKSEIEVSASLDWFDETTVSGANSRNLRKSYKFPVWVNSFAQVREDRAMSLSSLI